MSSSITSVLLKETSTNLINYSSSRYRTVLSNGLEGSYQGGTAEDSTEVIWQFLDISPSIFLLSAILSVN